MNIEKRQELERRLVRKLVRVMKEHGWEATHVDDGGDEFEKVSGETQVMEAVFAVDEAQICFRKGDAYHWVMIVLGNDGYDAIADWAYSEGDPDGFNAIMNGEISEYQDKLEKEVS